MNFLTTADANEFLLSLTTNAKYAKNKQLFETGAKVTRARVRRTKAPSKDGNFLRVTRNRKVFNSLFLLVASCNILKECI